MTFTSILDLDASIIDELVNDVDNDVLDSILGDSSFGDKEFINTIEMFNGTLGDKSVNDSNRNLSNYTEADIEASLEPIIFDDSIENPCDPRNSMKTEKLSKKRESVEANLNNQHAFAEHSYSNIMKTNESSRSKNDDACDFSQHGSPASKNTKISPPKLETSIGSNAIDGCKNTSESKCINKHNSLASTRTKAKKTRSALLSSLDGNKHRDRSRMTDQEAVAHIHYDNMRGRTKELFPVKLHKIIEYCESYGFSSIISWMPHGRSFKINNEGAFISKVMPHFFYQSKMSSFTRQLRMYGFHKIKGKSNVDRGAYFHELFLRSRPGLSHGIIRLDKPCSLSKRDEPNLYIFYPMPYTDDTTIRRKSKADVTPKCIRYSNCLPIKNNDQPNTESNLTTILDNDTVSQTNIQTNSLVRTTS